MDEWSLDVVMCASQKGLGVPPGLCLVCASETAIRVVETRTTKINSYFASWLNWLPGKYETFFKYFIRIFYLSQ
jgi:alanine-glyoxylate transaminase/serine-glyoxylate transaminase/serine-pyruvate transaminase